MIRLVWIKSTMARSPWVKFGDQSRLSCYKSLAEPLSKFIYMIKNSDKSRKLGKLNSYD
jgi:hypothetical protein